MSDTNSAGPNVDVVDILTSDHKDMIALIGQIKGAPDGSQRRDLADTLIAEVMRHAVAEEMYVYPAVEDHVPNGKEEVEHDKKEHGEIVKLMKRLEKAEASDPAFMELVQELESLLTHHASDEESEQFPKLRSHIPREKLVDIGQKWRRRRSWHPQGRTRARRIRSCSIRLRPRRRHGGPAPGQTHRQAHRPVGCPAEELVPANGIHRIPTGSD